MDHREGERQERVSKSGRAFLTETPSHPRRRDSSQRAEPDAHLRTELAVGDGPGEEGANTHQNRERREREGAVAPHERLEIDHAGRWPARRWGRRGRGRPL